MAAAMAGPFTTVPRRPTAPRAMTTGAGGAAGRDAARGGAAARHLPSGQAGGFAVGDNIICKGGDKVEVQQ